MNLDYFGLTNSGGRENNEDSFGIFASDDERLCFVVADGLGGHGFGEVASQKAVETFGANFERRDVASAKDFMCTALDESQNEILRLQEESHNKQGMKTTCVALCIFRDQVVWCHIGDSRLYAFKRGRVVFQTSDHSVPQMLVMARAIKPKQIRHHPDRNKLLKVLGTPWGDRPFKISDEYKPDDFDAFLLCSDGFWELIDEKRMEKHLKMADSAQNWIERMACEVNENGAGKEMDNYTAIAVIYNKGKA